MPESPETPVAEAHADDAEPELLSWNTIAGNVFCVAAGFAAKLRLFVSPVNPCPGKREDLRCHNSGSCER